MDLDQSELEIWPSRIADVGGQSVHRALPKHRHRTVGPWCFVDLFGPTDQATRIGPHPHIGLHTVTWLFDGEIVHTDSLGTRQPIRPGQLNLMTAGRGVAHAEQSADSFSGHIHGVQLWVAQPETTRWGDPAFEDHESLPGVVLGRSDATVLAGSFGGVASPARTDTPMVGVQANVRASFEAPLDPSFEHVVVVAEGSVTIEDPMTLEPRVVEAYETAYLPLGHDALALSSESRARILLLGGEPFGAEILMWWNFVARTWDEMAEARADWVTDSDRFAAVDSALDRIAAPPLG